MGSAIVTPPIRAPFMEEGGHEPQSQTPTRDWWLYFESLTRRVNAATQEIAAIHTELAAIHAEIAALGEDVVTGAADLLTPDIVPKIGTEPGTLVESGIGDDGTNVAIANRNFGVANPDLTQITAEVTASVAYAQFRLKADTRTYQLALGGSGTGFSGAFFIFDESVGAERFRIAADGTTRMWLSGAMRTLSVDGSGFVKGV